MFNPRQIKLLTLATPSLMAYGTAGLLTLLYFTSHWKGQVVLEQVPLYNKKYEPKDSLFP
eukprot:maker-scaffold15_size728074-snap-gene-5.19 protein:Tk08869 transcript:maker-scaffold15_size728074-snap-gene-5.19-mRNA-1 annotation:"hypothetical protein EAG_05916"